MAWLTQGCNPAVIEHYILLCSLKFSESALEWMLYNIHKLKVHSLYIMYVDVIDISELLVLFKYFIFMLEPLHVY